MVFPQQVFIFYYALDIACSRLSDSGEDAKVKGTRKVLSPFSSRFTFVFALSQFSGPNYLGPWKRLHLTVQTGSVRSL